MNFPAIRLPELLPTPVIHQKTLIPITVLLIISLDATTCQTSSSDNGFSDSQDAASNFQPSLAVVIGVLSIMFALTFLLLIYAKCCHRPSSSLHYLNQEHFGNLNRSRSRFSGIDKTLIESLPFFRFSALKGWKDGLECSVCLSKFEDVEILRLLPKCKHAFHINCVDQWLEKNSSCPLCRCKVSEEDVVHFAYSNSLRFLNNQSEGAREGSNMELFIEREGSARYGSGRSFRKMKRTEDEKFPIQESSLEQGGDYDDDDDQEILHKFNHRIIVSNYDHDLMMKSRWSNISSADLMLLKSEMINSMPSNRFDHYDPSANDQKLEGNGSNDPDHQVIKIKEEIERKRAFERKIEKLPGAGGTTNNKGSSMEQKEINSIEKRSMSEIVVHPRFLNVERSVKEGDLPEISVKEERLRRLWLPIARRTVQWFANRERRRSDPSPDQQPQINTKTQESLDV